jgi:hypothetical protein
MNQTSTTGDCDLYIRYTKAPTRFEYDYKDSTKETSVTLVVPNSQLGDYYVGVYGFLPCSYTLAAYTAGSCPNQCSGHGQCVQGQCQCNPGWNGTDCSISVTQISGGQHLTNQHVNIREWNYYSTYINVNSNYLQVIVNQTGQGQDCDLYLRNGQLPDLTHYDYRQASNDKDFSLSVNSPRVGTWFIGVFGFTNCDYNIAVTLRDQCPNNCSYHGSCQNAFCNCTRDYTGTFCETMVPALSNGQIGSGYVSDNSWNYFHYNAFSSNNLLVQMNQTSGGDCDLYVRTDSNPDRFNYNYRDISFKPNVTLIIPDPSDRTWYIGVYGYRACAFVISVLDTSQCPNQCSGHGACISGGCQCYAGWSGDDCSDTLNQITAGQQITGQITSNQWVYYSLSATTSSVTVSLRENGSTGMVWLYIAEDTHPTLTIFDASDTQSNNVYHNVHVNPEDTDDTSSWFIGVYGSPYLQQGRTYSFTVSAWATPF